MIVDDEDFEADTEGGGNDVSRGIAVELAERAQREEAEAIRLTAELDAALKRYRLTTEVELPRAMAEARMRDFTLMDGTSVKIEDRFTAAKLTDPDGLAYLDEAGYGYAIKTVIVLELPRADGSLAAEIASFLKSHPAAARFTSLTVERSVHQSTMASIGRKLVLEERRNPPLEMLGVHRRTVGVVGGSRPKTVELKGLGRR